jgi:hypothetical protein
MPVDLWHDFDRFRLRNVARVVLYADGGGSGGGTLQIIARSGQPSPTAQWSAALDDGCVKIT